MNVMSTDILSIFQHVTIFSLSSFVLSGWTVAFQLIYGPLQQSYSWTDSRLFKVSIDHSVIYHTKISKSENELHVFREPHLINSQQQALWCLPSLDFPSLHLQQNPQDLIHLQIFRHFQVNCLPTYKHRVLWKKASKFNYMQLSTLPPNTHYTSFPVAQHSIHLTIRNLFYFNISSLVYNYLKRTSFDLMHKSKCCTAYRVLTFRVFIHIQEVTIWFISTSFINFMQTANLQISTGYF